MFRKKALTMTETTLFSIFSAFTLLSALMVIRAKNPVYSVLFLILVFCNAAGLLVLLDLDFFAVVFLVVYVGAVAVLFLFVVMMLDIKISEVNETLLRYLPVGALIGCVFLVEVFLMLGSEFTSVNVVPQDFSFSNTGVFIVYLQFFLLSLPMLLSTAFLSPWSFNQVLTQWYSHTKELQILLHELSSLQTTEHFVLQNYTLWPEAIESITTIEALGQVVYTYYAFFFIVASFILLIAMIGAIQLTLQKETPSKKQEAFEQNARDFTKTVIKITN
jgi:NADH:ubiquinone oxidoreductase subunit 6 (subunit J)